MHGAYTCACGKSARISTNTFGVTVFVFCSTADTLEFKQKVLTMFSDELGLQGWTQASVAPALFPLQAERLTLKRISGAFTNAVFFVGYNAAPGQSPSPPTLLLRVYGIGSEALLSRRSELLILHTLSSLYEIGPHILGTFANGRVEEFYECEPIGRLGLRNFGSPENEGPACWVARRMREMHEVPLDVMRTVLEQGDLKSPSVGFGRGIENNIMASSHHLSRRRHRPTETSSPAWLSYSYFAHPSPGLFPKQANASTMSFDSLATSYDSMASPIRSILTPNGVPTMPGDSHMSPLALGPSDAPPLSTSPASRAPYPGVWRRLKRWTREASKVVEYVNAFANSPEGHAVCEAYGVGPLPVTLDAPRPSKVALAEELRATRYLFQDMMRCLLAVDLPMLCFEISAYKQYVRAWERAEGKSRRVFCHNDSQYGNLLLLRLNERGELPAMASGMPRDEPVSFGKPPRDASPYLSSRSRSRSRSRSHTKEPHQRLVVIDFEYSMPNPRAFDIANHFHEWRADYVHPTLSWSLAHHGAYPTREERQRWLHAYVDQGRHMHKRGHSPSKLLTPEMLPSVSEMALPPSVTSETPGSTQCSPKSLASPRSPHSIQAQIDRLEQEVSVWSPAVHAVWGLWGVVIAGDEISMLLDHMKKYVQSTPQGLVVDVKALDDDAHSKADHSEEFDNLRFALGRFEMFRQELEERGVRPQSQVQLHKT